MLPDTQSGEAIFNQIQCSQEEGRFKEILASARRNPERKKAWSDSAIPAPPGTPTASSPRELIKTSIMVNKGVMRSPWLIAKAREIVDIARGAAGN